MRVEQEQDIRFRRSDEYTDENRRFQRRGSMSTVNVTAPDLEVERVERWRVDSLERAGYDAEAAAVLAVSPEVDLHFAISLLERGCSVELALQILL
jgi:hypothetical protein